jgi:NADH:ubiquinone oxidoreductase subunit 6 (subunit J)
MTIEVVKCILLYVMYVILFGLWHIMMYTMNHKKESFSKRHFLLFLIVFWGFYIFNITYTGIMGWNFKPATHLELVLDNVSMAGMLTSLIILFQATNRRVKK